MQKKLYRSRRDRIIAGVAGGLADYSGIDPNVMRLLFVALALFTGVFPAIVFYIVAWAIIPEQPVV